MVSPAPAPAPHRIAMTPGAHRALEAATHLFYERGIHAVGVDLIAAEAGVTKKTLYDRFGSKEQLVVEYLAARDERWREFLSERLAAAAGDPPEGRVLAVFDASRDWSARHCTRGCGMVNAHAEIGDPRHPAYGIITGQKAWMLALFIGLARDSVPSVPSAPGGAGPSAPDRAEQLGRALMLLHEGALVAYGLGVFDDPLGAARDQARALLASA
ncbi:TetR/AcrR family transcriptional regulator [Streptomyces sp. NPDC059909]|uniref:TetR/AcrR family transcriptional regulator n=1 Tax=Streptomyces sp. NPDC059909 TaxID=3346998 RepID=UPI003663CDE9